MNINNTVLDNIATISIVGSNVTDTLVTFNAGNSDILYWIRILTE